MNIQKYPSILFVNRLNPKNLWLQRTLVVFKAFEFGFCKIQIKILNFSSVLFATVKSIKSVLKISIIEFEIFLIFKTPWIPKSWKSLLLKAYPLWSFIISPIIPSNSLSFLNIYEKSSCYLKCLIRFLIVSTIIRMITQKKE